MWMKIPAVFLLLKSSISGENVRPSIGMFPRNLTMNIVYDLPRSLHGLIPPSHPFRIHSAHPLPRNLDKTLEKNNEELWITMNNHEQPLKNHDKHEKTMNKHEQFESKRWKTMKNMKKTMKKQRWTSKLLSSKDNFPKIVMFSSSWMSCYRSQVKPGWMSTMVS